MSWSIEIESDKDLTKSMVHEALEDFLGTKIDQQLWGWSCEVDVGFPIGRRLCVSGAYYSEGSGKSFVDGVVRSLRKLHGISCSLPIGDEDGDEDLEPQ